MADKKHMLAVVIIALMLANVRLWAAPVPETVRGPAVGIASWTLSGRVYEGDRGVEPPGSTPLAGVTVELHGSNDPGGIWQFLTSTATDASGWYGLPVLGNWEFYFIIEVDPPGYYLVGATSVGGTVCGLNRIRYTLDALGGTLTGNQFWNKRSSAATPTPTSTVVPPPATPTPTPTRLPEEVADLGIHKKMVVPSQGPVPPGSRIQYNLNVWHNGPDTSRNVVLEDVLPPGVSFDAASSGCTLVAAGPPHDVVRCQLGDLPPSPPGTGIWLQVRVHEDVCGLVTNQVEVHSDTPDPNLDNNVAHLNSEIGPCGEPGVRVTKRLIDPPGGVAHTGDDVTFEIDITNISDVRLTTVYLSDSHDSYRLHFISSTPSSSVSITSTTPSQMLAQMDWSDLTAAPPFGFGCPLEPGDHFNVQVRFRAINTGSAQNCAYVVAEGDGVQAGGADCADVNIRDSGVDLQVSKQLIQPLSGPAVVSQTVRFEIRLENTGISPITVLRLHDEYDTAYLSFLGADLDPDDPADDGALDWSNLTGPAPRGFGHLLLPGQVETLVVGFQARTLAPPGQPTQNCTTAWYQQDGGAGHETPPHCARVPIVHEPGPGLKVRKAVYEPLGGVVYAGDTVKFIFEIANTGTTAFTNVVLADRYDTGCLHFMPTGFGLIAPDDPTDDGQLNWSQWLGLSYLGPGWSVQSIPSAQFQAQAGSGCDPTINRLEGLATDEHGHQAWDADEVLVRIIAEEATPTSTPTQRRPATPSLTATPSGPATPTLTRPPVDGTRHIYLPIVMKQFTPATVPIFLDDFDHGTLGGWRHNHGAWANRGDYMRGEYILGRAWNLHNAAGSDFVYEGTVNLSYGIAAGLTFRSSPDGMSSYDVVVDALDNVFKITKRPLDEVLASHPINVQLAHPYRIKVVARGSAIEGYLDGAKLLMATDSTYSSGQFGATLRVAAATYDDLGAWLAP